RRVLRAQVAGVELRREHAIERILELLENPARPAGVHRSAVLIPQTNARRAETTRTSRLGVARYEGQAETVQKSRLSGDGCRVGPHVEVTGRRSTNVRAGLEQS